MATKAELEAQVASLTKSLAVAQGRYEGLKRRVGKIAKRGCDENGWCDEIKSYLRELKLISYWPSNWIVQRHTYHGWDDYSILDTKAEALKELSAQRNAFSGDQLRLVERTASQDKVVRGA